MKKSEIAAARARVALLQDEGTTPPKWLSDIASTPLEGLEDGAESTVAEDSAETSAASDEQVDVPAAVQHLLGFPEEERRLGQAVLHSWLGAASAASPSAAGSRRVMPMGTYLFSDAAGGNLNGPRGTMPRALWDVLEVTPKPGYRIKTAETDELVSIRVEPELSDGAFEVDDEALRGQGTSPRSASSS